MQIGSVNQWYFLHLYIRSNFSDFALELLVLLPLPDLNIFGLLFLQMVPHPVQGTLVSQKIVIVLLHCTRKRDLSYSLQILC